MAYTQKNNPFPKGGCGRRRLPGISPFSKHEKLEKVVGELENASKMHLKQSKIINKHIGDMEGASDSPLHCWKGYRRVSGTKEFSKGSCEKIPNKKLESPLEKKKRKKKKRIRKTTKGKVRNFRSTKEGAGMTSKGVKEYRRKNPGSKLKTAVTGKVKPGSKAAKRRKSFCARSKSWTGERGKAARRRWKC